MSNELDCRGMNCPAPVLSVRDVIKDVLPDSLGVLVDNDAARQNVCRFLEHQGYKVSSEIHGTDFRVVAVRGNGAAEMAVAGAAIAVERQTAGKKIMVFVTSTNMGHGDDELGDMLMFNFIKTLKEIGPDLWRIAFVNSGVKFAVEGSEALPVLNELAAAGVKITACGACLAYFHVLDKLQVGEVTNMLEIITAMKESDSVITV